jgi:hypothetical protein
MRHTRRSCRRVDRKPSNSATMATTVILLYAMLNLLQFDICQGDRAKASYPPLSTAKESNSDWYILIGDVDVGATATSHG